MTVAITRKELGAVELRREARRCRDTAASRRMLALALVLEGASREEAARAAGMDRQTLRDWVHRYNAEGLAGLRNRPRSGRKPRLTPGQEAELAAAVEQGPDPDRDPRVGLRPPEGRLRGALAPDRPQGPDRDAVRGPAARAHGRRGAAPARLRPPGGQTEGPGGGRPPPASPRLSVRPRHPKADAAAQAAFKKASPSWWRERCPSAPAASRSRSGSKMRPASASRAR